MKISFYGAIEGITGSNFLVETENTKFLIDCGLFQGGEQSEKRNWDEFPYDPRQIDFVVLTHSHIDHMGRLPFLYKKGFRGKVYCSRPTKAFSELFMTDAAHILKNIAERFNLPELFGAEEIENLLTLYESFDYYQKISPAPNIEIKLYDAGHILGSAIIEVKAEGKTIIFSGDLGNPPVPLLKDTDPIKKADYVILESTYGDRNHISQEKREILLERAIEDNFARKGVVLMPAFAMERTQEILYEINKMKKENRIPDIPIYLDSPLAKKATFIYKKFPEYFDLEATQFLKSGEDFFNFPSLHFIETKEESKELDRDFQPKVIIAGSGMSTGGRILFHEKVYLPKPTTTLLIVGFQVKGTLGRELKEGAKRVTIEGEKIEVKAKIIEIESYSAHADQGKLKYWLSRIEKPVKKVFLVHGEKKAKIILKHCIEDNLGYETAMPKTNEAINL